MYVRVEVKKKRRYIKIDDIQNLTFRKFVKKVVETFNICDALGKKLHIFDQLDTLIDSEELLRYLIEKSATSLILKLEFVNTMEKIGQPDTTSDEVEEYFRANGGQIVLAQYEKLGTLDERYRHKMANILVDFCVEKHGLHPSVDEKMALAKAGVALFPAFRIKDTKHGIEMFYNTSNNSGWIISVLKTRRTALKRDGNAKDNNGNEIKLESESAAYTDVEARQDVEYLRTVLVNPTTMPFIEKKLLLTRKYRTDICEKPITDFRSLFPYFFTHPELVRFDFDHLFEHKPNNFCEIWAKYKNNIDNVITLHNHLKVDDYCMGYEYEICSILKLLKIFPNKPIRRGAKRMRMNFEETVSKMLVFAKTGTPIFNALKEDNTHPYILLIGPTPKDIRQYFIVVEQECINVPAQFSFTEVFDLFFKTHYVFNVSFDESIDLMMTFIKHYFYQIAEVKYIPTTHMTRVFNDLSR